MERIESKTESAQANKALHTRAAHLTAVLTTLYIIPYPLAISIVKTAKANTLATVRHTKPACKLMSLSGFARTQLKCIQNGRPLYVHLWQFRGKGYGAHPVPGSCFNQIWFRRHEYSWVKELHVHPVVNHIALQPRTCPIYFLHHRAFRPYELISEVKVPGGSDDKLVRNSDSVTIRVKVLRFEVVQSNAQVLVADWIRSGFPHFWYHLWNGRWKIAASFTRVKVYNENVEIFRLNGNWICRRVSYTEYSWIFKRFDIQVLA